MDGNNESNGSNGANGIRWRPMKMGIAEMDIGNHLARLTRMTPIARLTPRFFCPMVAGVNKVNKVNLVILVPSMVL